MPLFRALAKNMAPMTNADESPTNPPYAFSYLPVSLYSIYSLLQASVNMESDFTSIFLTHRKERFKTISLIKQPPKIIKTTFVASLT